MPGNSHHRNREIPGPPVGNGPLGRRGKADGRNPLVHGTGKSDSGTVPRKRPNKGGLKSPAEGVEGKPLAEGNEQQEAADSTQSEIPASTGLLRVREVAKKDKEARFTALLHHVTVDLLEASYWLLNRKSAPGIDGVTWKDYGKNLTEKVFDLHRRVHTGQYRAQPSKRSYIAKEDGSQRALGMATLDDKIVQQALVTVLNQIYEVDFLGFSYGFRPKRSQHQALDALWVGLTRRKVSWVLELDIRGFFDAIDHGWMLKFLEHRIADQRVLRLVRKWLRAGVSEAGQWSKSTVGTPQGATISPLLANVYLHYVLDLWAQQWRTTQASGEVLIVRFADDAVLGFQHKWEAERFLQDIGIRLQKFGLQLHPEKTRLIEFGRFAASNRADRGEGKPETFNFLGFTHICDRTRATGAFTVTRHTIQKRMRTRLRVIRQMLLRRRHDPVPSQGAWIRSVMNGYFQYHAVPGNYQKLAQFRDEMTKSWQHSLSRRSQRGNKSWDSLRALLKRWIPRAKILHPWPSKRFDARTQGKSRMR